MHQDTGTWGQDREDESLRVLIPREANTKTDVHMRRPPLTSAVTWPKERRISRAFRIGFDATVLLQFPKRLGETCTRSNVACMPMESGDSQSSWGRLTQRQRKSGVEELVRLRSAGLETQPVRSIVRIWPPNRRVDSMQPDDPGRCIALYVLVRCVVLVRSTHSTVWLVRTYWHGSRTPFDMLQDASLTLIRCRSAAGRSPPQDTKRVLENPRSGAIPRNGNTLKPGSFCRRGNEMPRPATSHGARAICLSMTLPDYRTLLREYALTLLFAGWMLGVADPSVVPRHRTYRRQQTPTPHKCALAI